MQLPAVLVRVIDPATGYFEKRRPRRRGQPVYRGGAVFGPGVPGGSRQATDEEIEALRRRTSELQERPRRELTAAQRDDVAAAVGSLLQAGRAAIGAGPGHCEAKIVRFRHGDSILEVTHTSGSSGTRISRRASSQDLFSELANLVTQLSAE